MLFSLPTNPTGMHAVMFFFLFNEFYKSTYKYKASMRERRALEKKLKEIENEVMANGIKSNGSTANGINGLNGLNGLNGVNGAHGVNGSSSLNQYYDSVNHNHINNKKNIEYNDNTTYYGNGNANGTTELINRKTK